MTAGGKFLGFVIALVLCAPVAAERPSVRHVPAERAAKATKEERARGKAAKRACVPVEGIAGAIVMSDRNVELRMRDGARWRMSFDEDCPALSYYQGFYYKQKKAGFLCAGRDAVIARSGGACPIDALTRTRRPRRR